MLFCPLVPVLTDELDANGETTGIQADGDGDRRVSRGVEDARVGKECERALVEQCCVVWGKHMASWCAVRIHRCDEDINILELCLDTPHRVLDCPEGTYRLDAIHRASPLQFVGRIGIEFVRVRLAPQSLAIGLDYDGEFCTW